MSPPGSKIKKDEDLNSVPPLKEDDEDTEDLTEDGTIKTGRSVVSQNHQDPLQCLFVKMWSGLLQYQGTNMVVTNVDYDEPVSRAKVENVKDKFSINTAQTLMAPRGNPPFMNGGGCGGPHSINHPTICSTCYPSIHGFPTGTALMSAAAVGVC